MGIADEGHPLVLENGLVPELGMRVLGELAGRDDSPAEQIILHTPAKNVPHRLCVARIDASQHPVTAQECLAGGVESNKPADAAVGQSRPQVSESARTTRSRSITKSSPATRWSQMKSRNGSAPGRSSSRRSC